MDSFDGGGYSAETVSKAILILKKLVEANKALPGVILFDGSLGYASIKLFRKFLTSNKKLSEIPLFVESSQMNKDDVAAISGLLFVDEVISLENFNGNLLSKVRVIQRIKDKNLRPELKNKIEYNIKREKYKFAYLKRAFDIIISLVLLAILSPLFIIIAIAIKLESRGPVFYISKRAGRGYKIFNFFKFRTMHVDADKKVEALAKLNQYQTEEGIAAPVFFKINNDPRITRVGSILRNTSLDELPQMLNVLLGDMSLVGNRPLPLYEAQALTTDEWAPRFMAPAGITGLWQIKKRGQDEMSVEERIGLDIDYANRNNFMYDLWIMANTPPALLQKSNS
jgi:lipopolysaccharide/colanic/teichoic acid biosynthesis glycosyltransferase